MSLSWCQPVRSCGCCGLGLGTQKLEMKVGVGPSHFLLQWVGISFHRSIGTLKRCFTTQLVLAASFCILESVQSSLRCVLGWGI